MQIAYMIGHRTIDEDIYELIEEKRALGDAITGGKDITEEELIDRLSDSLFRATRAGVPAVTED